MKRGGGHAWAMLIVLDWCRSFCYKETIKGLIIVSALKAVGIFKKKKKRKMEACRHGRLEIILLLVDFRNKSDCM